MAADFKLVVDIEPDESYENMKVSIDNLVSKLNKNPPKIKFDLDVNREAIDKFSKEIKDIQKTIGNLGTINISSAGASGISDAAKGVSQLSQNVRNIKPAVREMKAELNSVNTDKIQKATASINGMSAKGASAIARSLSDVEVRVDRVHATLEEAANAEQRLVSLQVRGVSVAGDTAGQMVQYLMTFDTKTGEISRKLVGITSTFEDAETSMREINVLYTQMHSLMRKNNNATGITSYDELAKGAKVLRDALSLAESEGISVNEAFTRLGTSGAIAIENAKNAMSAFRREVEETGASGTTSITQLLNIYTSAQKMITSNAVYKDTEAYSALKAQIQSVTTAIDTAKDSGVTLEQALSEGGIDISKTFEEISNAVARLKATIAALNNSDINIAEGSKEYYNALKQIDSLRREIQGYLDKWTKAEKGKSAGEYANLKTYISDLDDLENRLKEGTLSPSKFNEEIAKLKLNASSASTVIKSMGENTETWGQKIKNLSAKFSEWFSISRVVIAIYNACKKMVSSVIELDTAMTELKKVTDETTSSYDAFLDRAASRTKRLGASLSDTVTATADFARLGYSIEEAEKLSDAAVIYKNVGDGISDISSASESIIATMQAFGISADEVMSIVDKFNEVGNNYAISSEGIGEALLRSAATMHAAGNTLDQTIALTAAANTIIQNPESVGTTLKTVSMYLRAAKTEAEEAGESTDGMANSVSELRDEILALTGKKVDIQIDENTYKNTYEILKELSNVWKGLSDTTKANITELVGGKRNSNVVSAILENFSIAEKALETSSNSAGSAMAENEKHLDSIQGKIEIMKASFEVLAQNIISSDLIKFFVDTANKLLEFVNLITEGVNALGGLKTVLIAVGGALLSINLNSVVTNINKVFEKIDSIKEKLNIADFVGKFIKTYTEEANNLEENTSALSRTFKSLVPSATSAKAAIAGITTAITIAVSAYSAWRNKVEQQRQAAIETTKASAEESENIIDLYSAYQSANKAYESNSGSKQTLETSTESLLLALGYEASAIDDLRKKYGDLNKAINDVTYESLKNAADDAKDGQQAAYHNLMDEFGEGSKLEANIAGLFNQGTSSTFVSWLEDTEELSDKVTTILKNVGMSVEAGKYYDNNASFSNTIFNKLTAKRNGTLTLSPSIESVDDIYEAYDKLIKARDALRANLSSDDYSNSKAVSQIMDRIEAYESVLDDYTSAVNTANKSQAKADLFGILSVDGVPETTKGLDNLKNEFMKIAQQGDKYSLKLISEDDKDFLNNEEYAKAYKNILSEQKKLEEWGLTGYGDVLNNSGFTQTLFGNVDMDKRAILEWNEELKSTYKDALESWDYDPKIGSVDTVFGSSGRFGEDVLEHGVEIAFTPILQTEDGKGELLSKDTVDQYIETLVKEATSDGKFSEEKLFELDKAGRQVGDTFVKGLIAAADEGLEYDNNANWAETAGRLMHFSGEFGSMALAYKEIGECAGKAGKSTEEFLDIFKDSDENQNTLTTLLDDALLFFKDAFPGLSDIMEKSDKLANSVSENYKEACESITQSTGEASKSAKSLSSEIAAVQEVLNSQQAGKSISFSDFNSEELKDYQSALEYVNGTMQLNADKVSEIAKAKADEQIAINNTNKALEQAKYIENAKQIEKYRKKLKDAKFEQNETEESINASIDALLEENNAIIDACKQYDLLSASLREAVDAYHNWLNAQSSSDYGDMASDAVSAIQQIRDTYDQNSDIYGNYGSKKFKAAVDFIIPEDVPDDDLSAIEKYMANFKQYLTFNDDGTVEGLDIDKFLKKSVDAGLMSYSEDDGFKTLAGVKMEDFAEGLNLSSGVVQAFFDELQLKGATFDWSDEAVKTIGDLAIEANEAAESLRNIEGNSDLEIKIDVSDIEGTDEQIKALDDTIGEMNGVKSKPGVDTSEVENANKVIQYCIKQKQLLSQPDIMRVDTTKVEGDLGNAIKLLQQFQEANEDLELKTAIGADTTDAKNKVAELAKQVQGISPEIKASLNLDSTSVESINNSIKNNITAEVLVSAKVDASAIEGYNPDTKQTTVIYNPDISLLPTKFDPLERTVKYAANTKGLPEKFTTLTRSVRYIATGNTDGGMVNGTAHVRGTAKVGGDWGTAPGGRTLVGELGREIVVNPHTGRWYTVGDTGAEFVNIPRGSIVFNHIQTEDLLNNGYVAGRASALASGTAMVSMNYKPHKANSSSTSRKKSSSSSSNKSSSSSNKSSSKLSSSTKETKETESEFERLYKKHQHLVAMDKESQKDYLKWLNTAYKDAYKKNEIELDDYYKYQEEVYDGLHDLVEDRLDDIEHEISMRENYGGDSKKIISLYKGLMKDVEKEIAKARAQGLDDSDEYIQGLQSRWQECKDSIDDILNDAKDAAKDAIDELIDYRIDMIKQDIENEKDALNDKLDNLKDFYDKQKEMLQDKYDEEKYLDEQAEKRKSVSDIQSEIAMLENDDSAWAQKRKLELQEELANAQDELNDFEKDHALDMALDALDDTYEAQANKIESEIEVLEEKLNDPHALYNQALLEIKNNTGNLYSEMIAYNRKYGTGNDEDVKELYEEAYAAQQKNKDVNGKYYKGIVLKNSTNYKVDTSSWDAEKVSDEGAKKKGNKSNTNTNKTSTTTPKLTKGTSITVKKTATHFASKSNNVKMASSVPGGSYTVYNTSGNQVLIGRRGTYTGWIKKTDIVGYAKGTSNATAGLHSLDELGSEYLFTSKDGTNYRVLNDGDKVLNAKATDFLYKFANSGEKVLEKIIKSIFDVSSHNNVQPIVYNNEINMGDVIVQGSATQQTVSEIRRAQREGLTDMIKSLNKLNR